MESLANVPSGWTSQSFGKGAKHGVSHGTLKLTSSHSATPRNPSFAQDSVEFPIGLSPLLLGLLQEHDGLLQRQDLLGLLQSPRIGWARG